MPEYRVTNRETGQAYIVEAPFAQTACERVGWLPLFCHIELLREGPFSYAILPVPVKNDEDPRSATEREQDKDARDLRAGM